MKKLVFACLLTCVGFSVAAYADTNEKMKNSQYCMSNGSDPLCMGPETMKMRDEMMKATKEVVMKNRSNYCMSNGDDPICDPKMLNDTTGY